MSLNNRIYFRDHQSFQNSGLQVSDRVHPTTATSIHFAGTGSESQGQTTESYQLSVIAQRVEVDQVKVDDTNVNGSLVSATTVLTSLC
jgi:hypothetical protein